MRSSFTIVERLHNLTADDRFGQVIAALSLKDIFRLFEEPVKRQAAEKLNLNELAFLTGLWIRNARPSSGSAFDFNATVDEVYQLMGELHKSFIWEAPKVQESAGKSVPEFMTEGIFFREAFFYGAQGANDRQFIEHALQKYAYDEPWLTNNMGFSVQSVKSFYLHIKKLQVAKIKAMKRQSQIASPQMCMEAFTLSAQEVKEGGDDFAKIAECFSIATGEGLNKDLRAIGAYNEFQSRPIITLADGRLFIPLPFFLSEAVYESPFYWMYRDEKYRPIAAEHRGLVAEEMVYRYLADVFGNGNTYKGVQIKQKNGQLVTDMDVCAVHGDTLVVSQVKSKKLTALSRQGDMNTIKDDFKKAVENAFLQGLTSRNTLVNAAEYLFFDEQGRSIDHAFSNIRQVHIICVVLDVFPALTSSVHILLYEQYKDAAICLSIFDLQLICRMLRTPEKVMDYFSKRIRHCRYYFADSEPAYLGFYLSHYFRKHDTFDGGMISNEYAEMVEENFYRQLAADDALGQSFA